jgi:multiple sugar transport system permease protein
VPLDVVLALALALAVQASRSVSGYLRAAYFLPVVTSTIATALVWKWLYQPSFGLINQLLELAHLPTQRWLLSTRLAMPSIAAYAIWKGVGFNMVLFAAGLTTISETYYDAARVDGANRWQLFRRVTLPLLQPTMTFVVITAVIGSLQVFGPVYVMTGGGSGNALPGGPNNSTIVVAVLQWTTAFRDLELGYGSAMGIILFVIILALTLIQLRVLRTRWEY